MKLYAKEKSYELYNGDMLDMKEVIKDNSIDSIVCDPPYGLTSITKRFGKEGSAAAQYGKDGSFSRLSKGFMNESWDGSGIEYNVEAWRKCYDVLKPGGYLLAFGGSRTYHRIACAIEDAGFEIRDTIMWLYGSGFPKSMNIGLAIDKKNGVESKVIARVKGSGTTGINDRGNQQFVAKNQYEDGTYDLKQAQNEWQGWGTCLKPAYEPIIVARKPFKGSLVDNVIKNGVGGINIDECRVVCNDKVKMNIRDTSSCSDGWNRPWMDDKEKDKLRQEIAIEKANNLGRFPANVILTYDENDFDEVCGGMPDTKSTYNKDNQHEKNIHRENAEFLKYGYKERIDASSYNDEGSASRYFYCAKTSKKDRDEGLDLFEEKQVGSLAGGDNQKETLDDVSSRFRTIKKNIHPTVKPVELMQYLVRLVSPSGATILDPFMGSGSTGKAVMFEDRERNVDYKFIGIELTEKYLPIAKARIDYALNQYEDDAKEKEIKTGQMSLFDYKEK